MRINIVLYKGDSWILGKFANKLREELTILGNDITISNEPVNNVDVNHHIIYTDMNEIGSGVNTIMATHVDAWHKWVKLKHLISTADMCICMSSDMQKKLKDGGLNPDRICYINPGHDEIFKPAKLRVGFFSTIYNDGRKREDILLRALKSVDHSSFCMVIMGEGWEPVLDHFDDIGLEYEYYKDFDREVYIQLMSNIDYLLYTGNDEGSMSFLDAVMANKKTIVTPQGFHLDIKNGITHPVSNATELIVTLTEIANHHSARMASVKKLTWKNYALSHLQIWDRLLNKNYPLTNRSSGYSKMIMPLLFFKNRLSFQKKLFIHRIRKVISLLGFKSKKL